MQLHPLVDSYGLFIGHDAQNQWLYVDWKGEHDPASSQAACLLMLDSLRRWPCCKILNDNSNISRTTMQLTSWSVWWLDEMRAVGLQHIAWVLPRDMFSRQAVETAMRLIEHPRVGTFDDVASAYMWLQQQPCTQG